MTLHGVKLRTHRKYPDGRVVVSDKIVGTESERAAAYHRAHAVLSVPFIRGIDPEYRHLTLRIRGAHYVDKDGAIVTMETRVVSVKSAAATPERAFKSCLQKIHEA